jgi:hypothetical protein
MDIIKKILKEELKKIANKTLIIIENVEISNDLKFHITNKKSLSENIFKKYSNRYFDLINEVRELWENNLIKLNEEDESIVKSDLGKIGLYEGKRVYLETPIEVVETYDNYLPNHTIHQFLAEAWEDEMNTLKGYGMEVIEQFNSSPYNMLLIKFGHTYQIALTTNEGDFSSFEAQVSKPPTHKSNFMKIGKELVVKLEEWLSNYGDLFVGSYNKNRTNKYHRIFSRMGLKIGDIDSADFGNGIISYYFPIYSSKDSLNEAKYKGRTVTLNKPMQGTTKKFQVYVKNEKGNVIKVNFGFGGTSAKGKVMRIKKSNPERRKSFRARHNCDNPGPKTKARYWSCRAW